MLQHLGVLCFKAYRLLYVPTLCVSPYLFLYIVQEQGEACVQPYKRDKANTLR